MNNDTQWKVPEKINKKEIKRFPIESFPTEIQEYIVELSEELQVPEEMVSTGMLSVLALCNQGKYLVECKKGWREPLNLYCVNIANPSERKSPTLRRLTMPIYDYETIENENRKLKVLNSRDKRELLEQQKEKAKKTSRIEEIEEINRQLVDFKEEKFLKLIVDDITPEALVSALADNNGKLAMFSAEGGIFATINGRYNNNVPNLDAILKSYSSDPIRVDRKGKETEIINNPTLTILLFVQPTVIESIFSNTEFRQRGLCARFLYCCGESKVGIRKIETEPVREIVEDKYKEIIYKLLKGDEEEIKIITLTEEAYKTSVDFAKQLERRLKEDLEDIEDWAGKLHGNIIRIAANLHIARNYEFDFLEITNEEMLNAINIGEYFLEQAIMIYKENGVNLIEIKAKYLLKKLKEKGQLESIKRYKLYEISRGKYFKNVKDIEEPLKYLVDKGYFKEQKRENENKIGRPEDIIYEINPCIYN